MTRRGNEHAACPRFRPGGLLSSAIPYRARAICPRGRHKPRTSSVRTPASRRRSSARRLALAAPDLPRSGVSFALACNPYHRYHRDFSPTAPGSLAGARRPLDPDRGADSPRHHHPRPIQPTPCPTPWPAGTSSAGLETGSGKTLAFKLPLLIRTATENTTRVARRPRGLVLVPTRELADQVHDELRLLAAVLGLRLLAVYGGVPLGRQAQELRRGTDIIVATPGRLLDLLGQVPARWTGSPSLSLTRPTTWPTWASCPRSPHCWTASRPEASGCCSRPPSTARSTPRAAT